MWKKLEKWWKNWKFFFLKIRKNQKNQKRNRKNQKNELKVLKSKHQMKISNVFSFNNFDVQKVKNISKSLLLWRHFLRLSAGGSSRNLVEKGRAILLILTRVLTEKILQGGHTYTHRLWTSREEIVFTARPKIHSWSIFCLPHCPNFQISVIYAFIGCL